MLAPAVKTAAIPCGLVDIPRGASAAALAEVFPLAGRRVAFERGAEIIGQGEPADFVYQVVTGAVRTYRILPDGRRQIADFRLAGDVFGLEAAAEHRLTAEAIGPVTLLVLRRRSLAELAETDRALASDIWAMAVGDLQRTQDHMLMLGRQSAMERLCAFLMALQDRTPDGEVIELPMSRQDIADYLGLTIETVSRTLTQLQCSGWIRLVASRRLVLSNPGAVRRVCG